MTELPTEENGNWSNFNVFIKEEIKEEGVGYVEGHKDLYMNVMMTSQPALTSPDGSSNGNPPERCPLPLYSWDSTHEGLTIPHYNQGEEVFEIKTEIKEEEISVGENHLSKMKAEMKETNQVIKEESFLDDRSGHNIWNTSEGHLILAADYTNEDFEIVQYSPGVNIDSQIVHSDPNDTERSTYGLNSIEQDQSHSVIPNVQPSFQCADRPPGLCNPEESSPSSDLHVPKTIHIKEKPFSCPQCEKTFTKKSNLLKHQKIHTGEKPYSCSECGKCFSTKNNHDRHMRIHTGEKPFSCLECGKDFSDKDHRDQHMRIHTGEKPFSCLECGKSFSKKDKRNKHMRIHTGEKPFSCLECGKDFSSKLNCDKHMRIHTGEKPFSCSECGKGFSDKNHRDEHMRIHTGEKPFSCSECGKSFARKASRDYHFRIHTGEKPFSCPECGKGLASKETFQDHMRIHTGEKPFSCLECGKSFSSKYKCDKHIKTHMVGSQAVIPAHMH